MLAGTVEPGRDVPAGLIDAAARRAGPARPASAISARCRSIASVLHQGRTRPGALPSSGQIAPKM